MKNLPLIKMLKSYKDNRAFIELTLERIKGYKDMLNKDDIEDHVYYATCIDYTMPRGPSLNISPVERSLLSKQLSSENIHEWIKEEQSRIWLKQQEIQQIDLALKACSEQERYLIDRKYFDKWQWRQIEIEFNEKFRKKNQIGEEQLKKIMKKLLEKLWQMLSPFCEKWGLYQK